MPRLALARFQRPHPQRRRPGRARARRAGTRPRTRVRPPRGQAGKRRRRRRVREPRPPPPRLRTRWRPRPPTTARRSEVDPGLHSGDAALGDMFEIRSSELALKVSKDPAVKHFAHHMIADHTRLSHEMKAAASQAGLAADLPTDLDRGAHQTLLDRPARRPVPRTSTTLTLEDQRQGHEAAPGHVQGLWRQGLRRSSPSRPLRGPRPCRSSRATWTR